MWGPSDLINPDLKKIIEEMKRKKSKVYLNRVLGFINALLEKKSTYRPNLKFD